MIEDTHVLPLNDWREHIENRVCWCNPSLVEDDAGGEIVVHNSMDERETYENGRKLQ